MRLALNVYLLKKSSRLHEALDLNGFTPIGQVNVGAGKTSALYVRTSGSQPEWMRAMYALSQGFNNTYGSSSVQGLLPLRHKQRWFVITFGHSWQRVSLKHIEPGFGTRCVLNLAEADSLRSIRRDRVADASIQAIEQISDGDEISGFGMDIERDLLRGVKAQVDERHRFGFSVVGGDSFKGTIDFEADSLIGFCRRALRSFGRNDLSRKFPWFDKIKAVTDPSVTEALDERLAKAVSLGVRSVSLTVPDLLSWDQYDTFSFRASRRGAFPVAEPLTIGQWRSAHCQGKVSIDAIARANVYAYKSGAAHLVEKWPLRACIGATIKFRGQVFVTQRGSWFRVEPSFVKQTNQFVADVAVDSKYFPRLASASETEGDYNTRVSRSFGSRYLLLDRKLVRVVDRSSVEVCDLLRIDRALVCVKPWGGSSGSLSHLFNQAIVSAQLLRSSDEFCASVDALIPSGRFKDVWQKCVDEPRATYVLAILRGVPATSLPFFAKVALVNCVRSLRQMRIDLRYAIIT